MSDDPTTPVTTPTETPAVTEEMFPLSYVQQLRQEAAGHRTSKNEAVDAAITKTNAEWEAKITAKDSAITELTNDSLDKGNTIAKLMAAITAGVPTEKIIPFAEVLQGDTEEEIAAYTEKALTLFGGLPTTVPATDATQGKGGGPVHALNSDGLLAAVKNAVGAN